MKFGCDNIQSNGSEKFLKPDSFRKVATTQFVPIETTTIIKTAHKKCPEKIYDLLIKIYKKYSIFKIILNQNNFQSLFLNSDETSEPMYVLYPRKVWRCRFCIIIFTNFSIFQY